MTLLQLINNILRSIGEQPLTTSADNLGTLAKQAIQSAIFTVVSQTRHSSFMADANFNVIETDAFLNQRLLYLASVFKYRTFITLAQTTTLQLTLNFQF